MGIFKIGKNKIHLGEWKKKATIYIPRFNLELKVFYLPFRIGKSPNNDLVLEDNIDPFQCVILEANGAIHLLNIGLHNSINFSEGILYPFQSFELKKSVQVTLGKTQITLMPEIKKRKILIGKSKVQMECPYCGTVFDVQKGCPVCGFGKKIEEMQNKHYLFSNILDKESLQTESRTLRKNFGGIKSIKLVFTLENGQYKGKTIKIPENNSEITIGRSVYNAVSLSFVHDPTMSRFHCKLFIEGDKVSIIDNNSLNGTMVNGKVIKGKTILKSNDLIQIGGTIIKVHILK